MKETTLCYLEQDGRYLMLHRVKKENDENKDKWIGIGGKFEAGETPFDCVKREFREETGLILLSPRYRGIVTFVSDVWESEHMHLFTADAYEGMLTDCDEGDLAWVEKDRITDLPIWEGDKFFLRLLAADVPFFRLTLVYQGQSLRWAELDGEQIYPPSGQGIT